MDPAGLSPLWMNLLSGLQSLLDQQQDGAAAAGIYKLPGSPPPSDLPALLNMLKKKSCYFQNMFQEAYPRLLAQICHFYGYTSF